MANLPSPQHLTDSQLAEEIRSLLKEEDLVRYVWTKHARREQIPPQAAWVIWLIVTGRGWGKTRTGAETTREWGAGRALQIAVVAPTHREVRNICFEAPRAGLLAVIPPDQVRKYNRAPGNVELVLKNGTSFRAFSAEQPEALRGYAFDKAWCDEFAAWPMATAQLAWDNLWFTLRESVDPQVIVTTTPKPLPHVKKLFDRAAEDPRVFLTRGHMRDNALNLGEEALRELEATYAGTRWGRQELDGELLDDIEGALWLLWMFEVGGFRLDKAPELGRIVVAVDPAMTSGEGSDNTGIVVAGVDHAQADHPVNPHGLHLPKWTPHGYVLRAEAIRALPESAMRRACELYHDYKADCVVVEANNGGDYLPAVIRSVDPTVHVRKVWASRGKHTRAEPVSALYEQSRVHHVGSPQDFALLEMQMTTWVDAPGQPSPDLMDANVWALTELMVNPAPEVAPRRARDRRLAGRR